MVDSIINLQWCFVELFLLYLLEENELGYMYMAAYIFSFLAFILVALSDDSIVNLQWCVVELFLLDNVYIFLSCFLIVWGIFRRYI